MVSLDFSNTPAISRELDLSLYTRKALSETQMAFTEFCRTSVRPLDSTRLVLTITPLEGGTEDPRTTVLEFWNHVLDKSCQERLS